MKTPEEIAKEITDQYRRIFVLHGFHLDSIANDIAASIAKERAEPHPIIAELRELIGLKPTIIMTNRLRAIIAKYDKEPS